MYLRSVAAITLLGLILLPGCAYLDRSVEELTQHTADWVKCTQDCAVTASRYESIARRALYNAEIAEKEAKKDLNAVEKTGAANADFRSAAACAQRDRIRAKSTADDVCMYSRMALSSAADAKELVVKIEGSADKAEARAHERTAKKLYKQARYSSRRARRGAEKLKARWLSFLNNGEPGEPPQKGEE